VAAPGERNDGHDFAAQAVAAGAVAIIGGRTGLTCLHGVPYIHVDHPRRTLGILAHVLAGCPTRAMTVIGITGTNGKSSTVVLTRRVLESCGRPTAGIGTLGYTVAGETLDAVHTTPFAEELAEIFRRARAGGDTHAVMEVSSHALAQERVAGVAFDVAAFTNLTRDHLDYHGDMSEYLRAKLRLFEGIAGSGRFTVVNRDDPSAPQFIEASLVPCYTYGEGADCRACDVRGELHRTRFVAETPWGAAPVTLRLLGRHNVSNALCAIAICGGLGVPIEEIAAGIAQVESVPGRFEHIDEGQDFQVIVDYAHTDDGLRNVLRTAREICGGRLVVVFGCGGDRDRGKRPKMAAVAAALADFSFITSDNPRSEKPGQILLDVEEGMTASGKREGIDYVKVLDREEAIRRGIEMARPGDLVMIAGKGHEDYQILGDRRIHFDDREVARKVLRGLR